MLTDHYQEDEIQALIVLAELAFPIDSPNNNSYKPFPKNMAEVKSYFRKFQVELADAYNTLRDKGWIERRQEAWELTSTGKEVAEQIRKERPPIYYWYKDFYRAIENSAAFSEYSERVFGKNLGQHGFSDLSQIHMLLDLIIIGASCSVLDIGCGNGKIAEYISDLSGAPVTGIDYIPEAIQQAEKRTFLKRERLRFRLGNIESTFDDSESFDLILSIDSIYFSNPSILLNRWKKLLKPAGRMAIFYLSMDGSDLAIPLKENNLPYNIYDLSEQNWTHQQLKHSVAQDMREKFEAEGNVFIWENLMMESISSREQYDPAVTNIRRYLYITKGSSL